MKRLIECVPNFSEGRDPAKVDALVDSMSGVPGAWILDRTSDPDHNRTVITLAGEPEAVAEAAIRGVGEAAKLIDLTQQSGAHPRIGATDVLPFVPLEGISMEDCVSLARSVGHEIWERHRIPVYFYEAAAIRRERVNLENVRKGQFEGLLKDTLLDPDRSPDIGEPRLHPTAGATAVGARKLLIAYNIHLNTNDVSVARKIARAIRHSSGGLRYVKAIGVELRSRGVVQVSINLTDFEQTPLHRVFEMVKREAASLGCAVTGSEIIGLIPLRAIEFSAEYYLQIENFSPARVLESRLATVSGGSGAEVIARGATFTMVQSLLAVLSDGARKCAAELALRKHSNDVQPLENEAESMVAIVESEKNAAETNLGVALAATQIFEQWVQLETLAGPSMLSDFRVGRRMALGAARGALENLETNLAAIRDLGRDFGYISRMKTRVASIETRLATDPVTTGG